MSETILGTRIRELRRQAGVTQADLAHTIGISASYLNLIERNRRRITPVLLSKISTALDIDVETLDGAAERRLAETLTELAHLPDLALLGAEPRSVGELIGRFPGWARALAALARSEQEANATARALSDRLSHDPFLAETVHGMFSRVAAIRSASEILTGFDDIAPDERKRFEQIVSDEASSLTDISETLTRYFEAGASPAARLTPVDEVEALFERAENHFPEIEAKAHDFSDLVDQRAPLPPGVAANAIAREHVARTVDAIIANAPEINSEAATRRARARLIEYASRALLCPFPKFQDAAETHRYDVEALANTFRVPIEDVFARLAALPVAEGRPRFGHVRANASGTIVEMLGLPGLAFPRYAAACPLWILYRCQQTPETVQRQRAVFPNGQRFVFVARARNTGEAGFGQPRYYETDMLTMHETDAAETVYGVSSDTLVEPVGPACRLCSRADCRQRVDDPLTA